VADITVTATSVLLVSGPTKKLNAASTITAGQSLYETSSGTWEKADNDTSSTTANCSGIALNGGAVGQPIVGATSGAVVNMGATLVVGTHYVLSSTTGGVCPAADQATTDYATYLGVALTAANLSFQPLVSGVQVP
jgi:hypothetical protein